VINCILARTVSKLSQNIVQILDEKRSLCVLSPLSGATYTVHLSLIEKLLVDFLFVLIELFPLGVTAEALYGRIFTEFTEFTDASSDTLLA